MQLNGRVPAREVNKALLAAKNKGAMPPFTEAALLEALHLEGDEPDGLTLMERFMGQPKSLAVDITRLLLVMPFLVTRADRLILSVNEGSANQAQEALALMLGAVVSKQILREGDICSTARLMVLDCKRDDIIAPEVRALLPPEAEEVDR